MNNIDIGTYWTNGVRVPWFTKKTGRLVSKSYAVQKQREEVVGQFSQIISPLKNPSYALNPRDFFADHSIRKKN